MYIKLKKGILREIIGKAFRKAGNIYKLADKLKISKSTLSGYHMESRIPSKENLDRILKFINLEIKKEDISKELADNWKQIKGGKNRVVLAKKEGVFEEQLKKARKNSKNMSSKWHKLMKKNKPEAYYLSQYEKFKKIGEYKFTTKRGEKVRNILEKETADWLTDKGISYEFEPLVHSGKKYYFPDFLIRNNTIIECTMWRGYDKAIKLKEKIKNLKKQYKVYVLIPKALYNYYQILDKHLIFSLDEMTP